MYILYDKEGNCYTVDADFCGTADEKQPNVVEFYSGGCRSYERIACANTDNLVLWTKNNKKVHCLGKQFT